MFENRSRVIFFFCFLFLRCTLSFAKVDTTYVAPYKTNVSTRFFFADKFNSVLYDDLFSESTYKQNRPLAIGLGFYIGKAGMSFSYGFDFMRNKSKGKTESFDIQYTNCQRKFVADVMVQWYQGFYKDDSEENGNYQIYSNMKTLKIGVFGQYIFNHTKFSYAASLSQSERQLKSAGSFLLGGGVYYNEVHSDIPGFFIDSNQQLSRGVQLGPSGGYAYHWIFKKGFYLSLSACVGVNIAYDGKSFGLSPTATPRLGLGYDAPSWAIHINYVNNMVYPAFSEQRRLAISSGTIEIGGIYRFSWHPGFLRIKPKGKAR